jgi:hypothetical protein
MTAGAGFNILDCLDDDGLFASAFGDESWRSWRGFLGVMFGLPIPDDLQALARSCTGREDIATAGPFREAWLVVGRRAGKSRTLALIAVYLACFHDWRSRLAVGERGVVMVLAADRDQATVILGYARGLIAGNAMLSRLLVSESREALELANHTSIEVHTSNFRAPRGRTVVAALCDEVAFWRSETSANPAQEVVRALRPSLATLAPDSLLIGASSPYARHGLLWDMYRRYHGREGSPILVWQAASRTMNPSLPAELIADAIAEDPEGGAAEYLAEFRRDVAAFIAQEVVEAAVRPGRHELPPIAGTRYHGFLDPSGGSSDSFALAIAHAEARGQEGERLVLDCVREIHSPFNPEDATRELAAVLKSYGLSRAASDRYAGAWVPTASARHGVTIEPAAQSKSDLYLNLLPLLNAGRVELLDSSRLLGQLRGLERRTSRSGRDSVDHGPGGHDDVVNAAAGALVLASAGGRAVDFLSNVIVGPRMAMSGDALWPGLQELSPAERRAADENPDAVRTLPGAQRRPLRVDGGSYRSAFDPDEDDGSRWADW